MLAGLALSLVATGCYRATGMQRSPLVAEELPESAGDRVEGLKSAAGPGDYYLGNDFIHVAVDGTPFGDPPENIIAGAPSGGSIVDAGYLELDTSYHRVAMPGDMLNRLTPVVNQDPRIQVVFDAILPVNSGDYSSLQMVGRLRDADNRIPGAQHDSGGMVKGVTVKHVISLGKLDRYLRLTTTLVNESGAPLGIQNLGDLLFQQGGGFRIAVPATADVNGNALSAAWGMDIPGCDFAHPLANAVRAPMVGMTSSESAADTVDAHVNLGLLPEDADEVVVTSDPQSALSPAAKPESTPNLVVGGLPQSAGLASGASLTYNRRLYVLGGKSLDAVAMGLGTAAFTSNYGMLNGVFNAMDRDRYLDLRPADMGAFQFTLMGSAIRQGPLPCEVRIERKVGDGAWRLQRLEWTEPNENVLAGGFSSISLGVALPVGTYRVVVRNTESEYIRNQFTNMNNSDRPGVATDLTIEKDKVFMASLEDQVAPEVPAVSSEAGTKVRNLFSVHYFDTRGADTPMGHLQPLRFTFVGTNGTLDPVFRRARTLSAYFDSLTKAPEAYGGYIPGQNQFRGGNKIFGSAFFGYPGSTFAWLRNPEGGKAASTFLVYGTRGPLSHLESAEVSAYDGQTNTAHAFTIFPSPLPSGWTTFDLPGPSLATTGGLSPVEKLTSALAEGVQVVGHTEQDLQVNASGLYKSFRSDIDGILVSDDQRKALGKDPFVVGGRTSTLAGFGTVTALFTPAADGSRLGGALQPSSWTLADFFRQAKGQYQVLHRPWGPQGAFTLLGFDSRVPLGQGANAWWSGGGLYAFGKTNGDFDALELIRGEGFDGASPDAWLDEFKKVRESWFAILKQQTNERFTKALGLSSARFSVDTPVGLARTYLKAAPASQDDLSAVLAALKTGAAVASTGPLLDVSVGGKGPGELVSGPVSTVNLTVNLHKSSWMPVDQVRVVVNGTVQSAHALSEFTPSVSDPRLFTATFPLDLSALAGGKDAWIVVEAGVPLEGLSGPYRKDSAWYKIMNGIHPIAVANPIFVDVNGGGYQAPGL